MVLVLTDTTCPSSSNSSNCSEQRKTFTNNVSTAKLKNSKTATVIRNETPETEFPTTANSYNFQNIPIQQQNIPIILSRNFDNTEQKIIVDGEKLQTWAICPIPNRYAFLAVTGVVLYSITFLVYAQKQSWILYVMTGLVAKSI